MLIITFILFGLTSVSICIDVDGDIVKRLKNRFNDLSSSCSDSEGDIKSAYKCSGILLRGIIFDNTTMKYPWSKTSLNKTDALSVVFLRADQLFSQVGGGYDTGFIIYPHLKTPPTAENNKMKVFCAFPSNAYTNIRSGPHSCGQSSKDHTGTSRPCDIQGINSLEKWILHYKNIISTEDNNLETRQCGFDMTTESANDNFQIALAANIYLRENSEEYSFRNNELRIEAWNDENCGEIPIEAFFYFIDTMGGRAKATMYQELFYRCGGRKVPVVGLRLPTPLDKDLTIEI